MLCEKVVMDQALMQRSHERVIVTCFQTDTIVYSCIIDKAVDATAAIHNGFDGCFAFFRTGQFGDDLKGFTASGFYSSYGSFIILFIATDDKGDGAFSSQYPNNSFSDSFSPPRNDDNFIL